MGAMLCPIKHYPTLRYFGVEVLRGILLQFWGPELRDRPTDTLTDGQAVLGAKTDLLETHCGGFPLAECQKSRWNALQNHLIYAVLSYFTCIFCIALTVDLCYFCENEHGSESGSVRTKEREQESKGARVKEPRKQERGGERRRPMDRTDRQM